MNGIERAIELDAGIEEVWSAVTTPERLSAWFGATAVEADLRPGGRITFHRDDAVWRGLVEAVDAPHLFVFRWLPRSGDSLGERTRVEFRLEAIPEGTRLTVHEATLWEGTGGLDVAKGEVRSLFYPGGTQSSEPPSVGARR
jgi:uncharacterized protein YndB with AHSA1/START domain